MECKGLKIVCPCGEGLWIDPEDIGNTCPVCARGIKVVFKTKKLKEGIIIIVKRLPKDKTPKEPKYFDTFEEWWEDEDVSGGGAEW